MTDAEYKKMTDQRDLNMIIQLADLSEDELAKIIDKIDIRILLRSRQLSENFIDKYIIQRLDNETTLEDVRRLQKLKS